MSGLTIAEIEALASGPRFAFLSENTVSLLAYLLVGNYPIMAGDTDEENAIIDNAFYEVVTGNMIGQIVFFARDTTPAGTLVCDGSTYPRELYPRLWQVLPASLKTETEFTVPDLMGRTVRGGNLPGYEGGSDTLYLTENNLPAHAHTTGNSFTGLALAPGELPVLTPNPIPAYTGITGSGSAADVTNAYTELLPCVVAE